MTQTAPLPTPARTSRHDQSWVYLDGEIARYADARLGLLTHALHYGTGVFEGIRAYWNADAKQLYGLRVADHFDRMRKSAKVLQMNLPQSTGELCEITYELLRRNQLREDCYIRPLLFKNIEEIGVRLHDVADSFAIAAMPMGNYVSTTGLRCMVSSWRRVSDTMAPVRTKCTGVYINSALAKSEALQNGFDEAIFLTQNGHVSEGSAENIFILRNGELITPPAADNILEGITREGVMTLARQELKMPVTVRSFDRSEMYCADEVFLCGTGAQIAPVVDIDHRIIGDGVPGVVTCRIQQLYDDAVKGHVEAFRHWLTPVY